MPNSDSQDIILATPNSYKRFVYTFQLELVFVNIMPPGPQHMLARKLEP